MDKRPRFAVLSKDRPQERRSSESVVVSEVLQGAPSMHERRLHLLETF